MEDNLYDVVIIGSGPAGLTAAIYNIRADLKTVVVGGDVPGGQLTITTLVDNFPGFAKGIGGVKLMMEMQEQVKSLGGEIKDNTVLKIEILLNPLHQGRTDALKKGGNFAVTLDNGEVLESRAVIVATGAKAKWLELPKEKELIGRGISGCATCDGMFFRDKIIAIIGGGDTACIEAEFLTKFAKKVYLIHRRDSLRASAAEQKNVFKNKKIEIIWNSEVVEINSTIQQFNNYELKNQKLENIKIKNNKTGEEKIMEVEGLFVAIGRVPAVSFVKDLVEIDENGYIIIGKNREFSTMTSLAGIFAAGDCTTIEYKQAIVAAGEGCKAGLDAERWLLTRS